MAYIFERKTGGSDYTPFEPDNEDWYRDDPRWSEFLKGKGLCLPTNAWQSATQLKKTAGQLPDILTVRTTHCCNARFRDFVEQWEPGLHFFKPVELKRKNGERVGDYFAWTVGQDIDCVLTAGMDRFWRLSYENGPLEFSMMRAINKAWQQHYYPPSWDGTRIAISGPAVRGRHLWTAGMLAQMGQGGQYHFMSDAMHKAYKKEKFKSMALGFAVDEVDRPWVASENMGPMIEAWRVREAMIDQHWPKFPPRHGSAA